MGKGWKVVGGLGLVLVAVGFWSKSVVVIVLGIVLTLVGERQGARAAKETHEQLEGAAILPALKGVFDSAALQTNERLTRQDIDAMQLLLHQDFHYVDGCDKVTAKYRGVEVLLGNVRLMQTDTLPRGGNGHGAIDGKRGLAGADAHLQGRPRVPCRPCHYAARQGGWPSSLRRRENRKTRPSTSALPSRLTVPTPHF